MKAREAFAIAARYDRVLERMEDATIARIDKILVNSFTRLDRTLKLEWEKLEKGVPMLQAQRQLYLADQVGYLLQLINPNDGQKFEQWYQELFTASTRSGIAVAGELLGETVSFANLPLEAIAYTAEESFNRLLRHGADFADKASTAIGEGLVQGWGAKKVAQLLRERLDITKRRSEDIARTESIKAYGNASQQAYLDAGVDEVIWMSVREGVCPICTYRNGKAYKISTFLFPAHVNCLVPGTVVSATNLRSTSAREYVGEVVTIETAFSNNVTVTPNHPILTRRGWVAASSLNNGDEVVATIDRDGLASTVVDPDEYLPPTVVEQVTATLPVSFEVFPSCVEITPEDFHGDGMTGYCQVNVINPNGLLRDYLISQILEPSTKSLFGGVHFADRFLGDSHFLLPFDRGFGSSHGFVGGFGVSFSLLWGAFLSHQAVRLGLPPSLNPVVLENQAYGASTPPKAVRDRLLTFPIGISGNDRGDELRQLVELGATHIGIGDRSGLGRGAAIPGGVKPDAELINGNDPDLGGILDRLAGLVRFERVTKINRHTYSGLVYNLETEEHYYTANNIITHNCRCVLLPKANGIADSKFWGMYAERVKGDRNPGMSPFEKNAGFVTAPKPIDF